MYTRRELTHAPPAPSLRAQELQDLSAKAPDDEALQQELRALLAALEHDSRRSQEAQQRRLQVPGAEAAAAAPQPLPSPRVVVPPLQGAGSGAADDDDELVLK